VDFYDDGGTNFIGSCAYFANAGGLYAELAGQLIVLCDACVFFDGIDEWVFVFRGT
jgi:hypothetical protein